MRECALCTLDNWLGVAHSDKMLPYITVVLTDTKVGAVGRKGFFDWLQNYFMATAIFRHEDILSEVKTSLLSTLVDTEYEKFLYEASVAPTKSTSSAVTGGMDGLPREDISERISPTRTNVFCRVDWPVEKSSKGILSDVLKCLGYNKKHMHESTLSTLDTWLGVAHPNKMLPYITALSIVDLIVCCCLQLPYITAVLTYAKVGAEERKDFFDWLSRKLPSLSEFPDVIQLLKPTAFAMADKSVDVRKSAACFNEILSVCGQETRVVPNKGYGQEYILSAQDINTNLKDSRLVQIYFLGQQGANILRKDYCFQIQIQDLEVSVLF
ncbi:hypothetical protein SASPL_154283 [Salvia splendens]|uniref:Cytoskeleton-associated protein 5 n=1 Tax=Salvia splendens TaxID=180675 RepID=A0A8X8VZW5_SALSN|nr:hypothetical protein SASPL_154283 [Salvia splendens]